MAAIMTHGTTEAITVDIMTLGIMVDTTTHGTTEDIMEDITPDIGVGTIHGTTITTTADGMTTITMATRTYRTATTPPISVQDTGPGQRQEIPSVQTARPA